MYHKPVLLEEAIDGLNIQPDGTYVDATFGGGGHAREIFKKLRTGKLIVFDQDEDAKQHAIDDAQFILVQHNFRYLKRFLKYFKAIPVNGILADLGVSSHQIDTAERGFSTRFESDLDMRMDKDAELTAYQVLNEYSEERLSNIFREYGELKRTGKMARAIINERKRAPLQTTEQLKQVLLPFAGREKENKFFAKVFQALRIEVNQELEALKEMLVQAREVLATGGRLVVISYHSLEDRIVKHFIRSGKLPEEEQFENPFEVEKSPFKIITKKPVISGDEELLENPRARSAKLRIAEKI